MLNVLANFIVFQRTQMVADRDALAKLTKVVMVQSITQFRLAHQNNLQKFPVVGFEIGEQSDLFEQIVGEVLRFVDDENGFASLRHLFEEKMIDFRDAFQAVETFDIQPEFHRDGFDELVRIKRGIQNQRGGKIFPKLIEQRAAQGRFARADFAGQLHETFSLANPVEQMVERFAMFGAVEKETRIWRYIEWRLGQAVIFQIHADLFIGKNARRKAKWICFRFA